MLRVTNTSSVTEDQIDHLGHMNVRFYAVNALAGTRAVLDHLPGWEGRPHLVHDTYTRHYREQLLGTPLVVRSAVLGADGGGVRIHHELAAEDTGVLAATFVHRASPVEPGGDLGPVPDAAVAAARAEAIGLPEYASSRTISLDADVLASAPDLDTAVDRGLAMRKERRVTTDECDADGRYRIDFAAMLTWGGESIDGRPGDHLHEASTGELMGWASMETRIAVAKRPSVGDRIQSFAAGVAIFDKAMHRIHWVYDLETGELLTAFEGVSMAFDIRGRRPMSIPDGYRRIELERLQPDLDPRAARAG